MNTPNPTPDPIRDRTPDDELLELLVTDVAALNATVDAMVDAAGAALDATPVPHDLGEAVLRAALAARPHGLPIGPPSATPTDAFRATAAELDALIASLDANDLESFAHPEHGRVRDLIAHLAGVEEHLVAGLERPLDDGMAPSIDHVEGTRHAVEQLFDAPSHVVAARWKSGADRVLELAEASSASRPIMTSSLPTDVDGMLVLRTFELWTHLEDICAATGRALPGLDAPRLSLMSSRLVNVLPTAVLVTHGAAEHGTVRFVLTGPGGGTYDRSFAPAEPVTTPTAVIVIDTAGLCRAASNRMARERLKVTIEGDTELAERVLASVGAFALD